MGGRTFVGHPSGITVDARIVGLRAAGVATLAKFPIVVVMLAAAGATALTRLLT